MQLNSAIPITLPVATQNNPILSQGNSLFSNSTKNFDKCYFNEENHDGIGSSTSSNAVFESSHKPPIKEETYDDDVVDSQQLRETVLQYYYDAIESLKCNFRERLQELYFIQSGGNMVDYPAWKIRPNPHLITFLSAFCLDENMSFTTPTAINTMSPAIKTQPGFDSSNFIEETPDVNLLFTENVSNDVKLLNNGCIIKSDQYSFNSAYSNDFVKNEEISNHDQSIGPKESLKVTSSQQLNSEIASENIAGQVKHESDILDRISQLRKNGLWSLSRLPKVCEQLRKKSHWDFLLEEMQWLAADFAQEKKWKRNMGRKISRAVLKYHQDQASQNKRAQNEEKVRLRRIASGISKEVRIFWQQIEKVACYKQQSRQEEQRKKALDLHLNFIVDQTERYSSWLVEGMKESTSSPFSSKLSDNEFEPESDIDDDETTIAEEENQSNEKYEDELEALRRESEMPIEDLINAIPENILTKIGQKEMSESESDETSSDDESDEYVLSEDEEDVEDTLDAEEKYGDSNHKEELEQLQRDSELPINELIKLYGSSNNVDDTKAAQSDLDSDSNEEKDIEKDKVPLSALIEDSVTEDSDKAGVPNKELNDAAATAESLQPKGFTLSTTQVKTSVPFLLKHSLREYQHIGLDWLVTMYSKQLNGILADEMGLGKTIQTIALLAHLACEEGCWGPHLIIVPTSVMLNWELELKKWCPGFKILTYFGTQKERKIKRAGWCKPNAFHVCITSYKLVIQDHQAFKRRKWKYIILDEAQNIKNFKSQRWQTLLNFNSHRRLLLTGTPLQNSLMELWSLMHFLMPNIFESHQDFKEWFSNPLTGMIEGSREYSEGIIKRLHTVLRPFLLRRLKSEVELQMPKKYEHVVMCRLSKRQRFLYDEFMGRTKTKETIAAGNFLSVINILMQLRKVCNHPDLFELRPTVSPFVMEPINYSTASLVDKVFIKDPLEFIDIRSWNFCLIDLEMGLGAYQACRSSELKVHKKLIEDVTPSTTILTEDSNALSTMQEEVCVSSLFNNLDTPSRLSNPTNITETNRSYLDIIDFSQTTAGCASIGDILTRQVEESLDVCDVDIVNIDNDSYYSDIYYSPAAKKRKVETTNKKKAFKDYVTDSTSPFYLEHIKQKADSMLASRLQGLARINERHCSSYPLYGVDLRAKLNIVETGKVFYRPDGVHCECETLKYMIKSPKKRIKELQSIIERFALFVHPVLSSPIQYHVCNPAPSKVQHVKNLINDVSLLVGNKFSLIYPLKTMSLIQFPETRLVQYDCGKLQALNDLLRHLKIGKHRVLIFTQMTKMLDVLERFLNYHGYIYLRLDGTTKVEQRQILMERFNQDNKIFIFILSTRSGGLGINLTGADTVVFYDSDWNPTMDAQAQDRCHRIGQTRDVHIYRLISERTVEENILKKAQQKRLLGNIAIEGGNFNTAFFKQESVQELFNTNSANNSESFQLSNRKDDQSVDAAQTNSSYEQVLGAAEEEEDAVAAQKAKAEQELEMVEFTENANNETNEKSSSGLSKVEKDLLELESQLRPIELLALKFVESSEMYTVNDEVIETEKKLEQAKKDWELDHLRSIKEAEEQRNAEQEDEMLFTYVRDSTYSKVNEEGNIDVVKINDEDSLSPQEKLRKRVLPLISKLGDNNIEKIKKTAADAVRAKNDNSFKNKNKRKTSKPSKNANTESELSISNSKINVTTSSLVTSKALKLKNKDEKYSKNRLSTEMNTFSKLETLATNDTQRTKPNDSNISLKIETVTLRDFISTTLPNKIHINKSNSEITKTPQFASQLIIQTNGTSSASSTCSLSSPVSDIGEIRRSSRTPRPKFIDNDWFLFS